VRLFDLLNQVEEARPERFDLLGLVSSPGWPGNVAPVIEAPELTAQPPLGHPALLKERRRGPGVGLRR